MSKLILTTRTVLHLILQYSAPSHVFHCQVRTRNLAPIAPGRTADFDNGNCHRVSRHAAQLIRIKNYQQLLELQEEYWINGSQPDASRGDVIVVLPMNPLDIGRVVRTSHLPDYDLTGQYNRSAVQRYFHTQPVDVLALGKRLPTDVAHIGPEMEWRCFDIRDGKQHTQLLNRLHARASTYTS